MTLQIRKAERRKAKLRLGISAPTGAGKTFSSLLIASGIGPKVGLVDTENGSGDLYADSPAIKKALPNGYDIINLSAPFDPVKYVEAITAFEDAKYDVIIIDSLSHAWAGTGGSLDKQGKEADKTGNSYTAWRKITPAHNALVDKMLQSPSHIIACMRAKTEYVQEKNEQGKTVVRKVGMAPVMRDGIEFEFTVFGEIDQQHNFQASKDRTELFGDAHFVPSKKTGEALLAWLNSGADVVVSTLAQKLGDELPVFDEPKKEITLLDSARTYWELLKHAETSPAFEFEVENHAKLMASLSGPKASKEESEAGEKLRAFIVDLRSKWTAKNKEKIAKREADDSVLNDPLPDSMANKLTEQLMKGE